MSSQFPASQLLIKERQSHFDAVLVELAQFAQRLPPAPAFYQSLLESIGREVAAAAGAAYRDTDGGPIRLAALWGDDIEWANATQAAVEQTLQSDLTRRDCRWIGRCVLTSVSRDGVPVAWIGIKFDRELSFEAKTGVERFIAAASEVAASFEAGSHVQRVKQVLHDREAFLRLWHQVEGIEDPDQAAWQFVNDARRVMGCERLAMIVRDGRRTRFWQMSDVPRPDRHSDYVRQAEDLAARVPEGIADAWVGVADSDEQSSPFRRSLREQLAVSGAQTLGLLNLEGVRDRSGPVNIVLLVENFVTPLDSEGIARIARVREDLRLLVGTLAERKLRRSLGNRVVRRFGGYGAKRSLLLIGAVIAGASLLLIPVPFTVVARGELLPASRREIFAPADGVVSQLAVRHNQEVERDELLVVLESAELEAERSRLQGLLSTAQEELTSAELARVGETPTAPRGDRPADHPAALAEEIRIRRDSLKQQLDLVDRQLSGMTLRSPIQGTVITFSLANRLESRPVRRGQSLLQVANLDGDWELRLRVPERDSGYVLDASEGGAVSLPIKFLVTNDPARTFETRLASIALVTHRDHDAESVVDAVASVPKGVIERPRPGASVIAKIDCGKRTLGFVWFHEVINAARSRLFF